MRLRGVFVIGMVSLVARPFAEPSRQPAREVRETGPSPAGPAASFDEGRYVADLDRRIASTQARLVAWQASQGGAPNAAPGDAAEDAARSAALLVRRVLLVAGCDAPARRSAIALEAERCLALDRIALTAPLRGAGGEPVPAAELGRRLGRLAAELGRARSRLFAPAAGPTREQRPSGTTSARDATRAPGS